jgi:hypothetical protein
MTGIEKRAYVEFYGNLLGRYLAKIANMEAPIANAVAPAAAPQIMKKPGFNWRHAGHSFAEELGPASGAVLGATVAGGYGISPLAGAAMGYGVGAVPQIAYDMYKARKMIPGVH